MSQNKVLTYDERVTRIMFIREHRRNLLTAYCDERTTQKEKTKIKGELEHVRKALRKLDPDGMFPP